MSDKTEGEIYEALKSAGVQAGDLVVFDADWIGFVYCRNEDWFSICRPLTSGNQFQWLSFLRSSIDKSRAFPTHFCRPIFSREAGAFALGRYFSADGESSTATISYDPVRLTLEERVERLEKLQGVK